MDTLQEKVSLTYASPQQKKRVKSWKQRQFSIEEGSSEEQGFLGFIRDIADFFAWHFGYSSEIEADYIKQLQAIVAELSCDEEIYLAENGRGEREELLMKVKDVSNDSSDLLQKVQEISSDSSKRGMKAYLLERVVKSHSKDRKTLFRTEKNVRDIVDKCVLDSVHLVPKKPNTLGKFQDARVQRCRGLFQLYDKVWL